MAKKHDDARAYILELFKIVSTDSILVVTSERKVIRLYCPLKVICKVDVPPLVESGEYVVEAVKMTLNLEDVFIIDGKAYFIWYFTIVQ
ncbi:hypothetical protein [Draconibacterium orientale]|uniref:hypothetical protein n=1 Tax=Draconibacterium orientale TaxID=1168034 RepID=UPI0029C08C05|nr:hypothetical protein [Draconibacterium orientale]